MWVLFFEMLPSRERARKAQDTANRKTGYRQSCPQLLLTLFLHYSTYIQHAQQVVSVFLFVNTCTLFIHVKEYMICIIHKPNRDTNDCLSTL